MYAEAEMLITIMGLVMLLYAFILVWLLIKRLIRIYSRNQCLKFTRSEVKEKRKEVETLQARLIKEVCYDLTDFHENTEVENNYRIINNIFYIYNDLIIGIYEGLFDERYVKMTIGQEILMFYKRYGRIIVENEKREGQFLALEMMLKKWDTEGYTPDLRDYKHRRL